MRGSLEDELAHLLLMLQDLVVLEITALELLLDAFDDFEALLVLQVVGDLAFLISEFEVELLLASGLRGFQSIIIMLVMWGILEYIYRVYI